MVNKRKKILVATGSRAEYGLLRWVIDSIKKSDKLILEFVVTGSHLSSEFGFTINEIQHDGFKVNKQIEMLMSSDSKVAVSKSVGLGIISFADYLAEINPDLVLILGDRYEIFSVATASMMASIPIGHIHGGELTEGAYDDAIRHSITKMSYLHFVATERYRHRVIQLGENPNRVFTVGGLGIESINKLQLLSKKDLECKLNIKFTQRNLLITYHPATLDTFSPEHQINELLHALDTLIDTSLIFTASNADTNSGIINSAIKDFCKNRKNANFFTSLGQQRYMSCVKYVDCVIGNSSSGLLEVPSLSIPTINIGDRQKGREKANSIIDCNSDSDSIIN